MHFEELSYFPIVENKNFMETQKIDYWNNIETNQKDEPKLEKKNSLIFNQNPLDRKFLPRPPCQKRSTLKVGLNKMKL
jgi:hypothetical protein